MALLKVQHSHVNTQQQSSAFGSQPLLDWPHANVMCQGIVFGSIGGTLSHLV